jgi:hypothetical protein
MDEVMVKALIAIGSAPLEDTVGRHALRELANRSCLYCAGE